MSDDEIGRLHAELERLAAEVAALRERLDDRDMEQAARDDALNRAMSGGRRPWSPRLLDGAAGAKAALVALTVATGAATICEPLQLLSWPALPALLPVQIRECLRVHVVPEALPWRPLKPSAPFARGCHLRIPVHVRTLSLQARQKLAAHSSTETRRFGYRPICSCKSSGSIAVR